MKNGGKNSSRPPEWRRQRAVAEGLGLLALAGLALFFLATSWRKWPDPLIDFGRELYVPWRLANGAVLYRDVDDFYGPLSQYLNAGLFALFGPGLMVLVAANLAVFAAILGTLYVLFRRGWGRLAAFVSASVFVAVFGFSRFVTGSYTYAAPYAHEATHGMLVCLLLILALAGWVERATPFRVALAGGLLGLTAVLKPEFLFAGGLATAAAFAVRRRTRGPVRGIELSAWALGAVLPTAGFVGYFSRYTPWRAAVGMACRGWWTVAATRFTGEANQLGFLGFDAWRRHLFEHAWALALALLVIAAIAAIAWAFERSTRWGVRLLVGALGASAILWLSYFELRWASIGRCLLGLVVCYAIYRAVKTAREAPGAEALRRDALRLLIAVFSAGMMARMLLNGRIYQFGFYQAALAGVLVPAVLIGELPEWLGLSPRGRAAAAAGVLLLLVPGVAVLAAGSQRLLRMQTYAVGEGADRFYALPPERDPTGELVRVVSESLGDMPRDQTLVVLPEGEMINYLARMRSPVAPFYFYSSAIGGGREEAVVDELRRSPPDWVVVISRDLREYGVTRYGEASGKGMLIMAWVEANYRLASYAGGDPFDNRQKGAVILRKR